MLVRFVKLPVIPVRELEPACVGIVNNIYRGNSVKEGTREDRGDKSQKNHIQNVNQHMIQ